MEFTKMNGAGNDFLVIDNRFYHFTGPELSDLARKFCPRRTGVGADGLLALEESARSEAGADVDGKSARAESAGNVLGAGEAAFRMRYLNADGSVGTMCGNGARCLARYARDAGIPGDPLRFITDAGLYEAAFPGADAVRLYVPPARDFRELPADGFGPARCSVWTGTEHLVVFVDDVDAVDIQSLGPKLRHTNPPRGANVNFAQVGAGHVRVRTWEKGVEGETLACGTGATAVAVAVARLEQGAGRVAVARREQGAGRVAVVMREQGAGRVAVVMREQGAGRVAVVMPGGTLTVGLTDSGDPRYLEGPADYVFRGTLEVGV